MGSNRDYTVTMDDIMKVNLSHNIVFNIGFAMIRKKEEVDEEMNRKIREGMKESFENRKEIEFFERSREEYIRKITELLNENLKITKVKIAEKLLMTNQNLYKSGLAKEVDRIKEEIIKNGGC